MVAYVIAIKDGRPVEFLFGHLPLVKFLHAYSQGLSTAGSLNTRGAPSHAL